MIGIALQRIGADLAAAEYVPANRESRHPLFDGSELSVTFVRTSLGPNAGPGLDVVRLGETTDRQEFVTVRSRTRFTPLPPGFVAVGASAFRRSGRAAARAVPAVVCLCGPGPDLENHLARGRKIAGHDQADGSRCWQRTRVVGLYYHADSRSGAQRLRAAGGRLRRQEGRHRRRQGHQRTRRLVWPRRSPGRERCDDQRRALASGFRSRAS